MCWWIWTDWLSLMKIGQKKAGSRTEEAERSEVTCMTSGKSCKSESSSPDAQCHMLHVETTLPVFFPHCTGELESLQGTGGKLRGSSSSFCCFRPYPLENIYLWATYLISCFNLHAESYFVRHQSLKFVNFSSLTLAIWITYHRQASV